MRQDLKKRTKKLALRIIRLYSSLSRERLNPEQLRNAATENLRAFSLSAGIEPIECVSQDPDEDGYVTCTAKNDLGQLLDLKCAYDSPNQGCLSPSREE